MLSYILCQCCHQSSHYNNPRIHDHSSCALITCEIVTDTCKGYLMLVILLSFLNTLQERQKTLKVKNTISYLRQSFEVGGGARYLFGLTAECNGRALDGEKSKNAGDCLFYVPIELHRSMSTNLKNQSNQYFITPEGRNKSDVTTYMHKSEQT